MAPQRSSPTAASSQVIQERDDLHRQESAQALQLIGYAERAERLYDRSAELHEVAGDHQRFAQYLRWVVISRQKIRLDSVALLEDLAERGLAWAEIARIVGVSVPAVRKWRMGLAQPTPANHQSLGLLAALLDLLEVHGVRDPAAWLVCPLVPEATLTPLDLYLADRADLVLGHACGRPDDPYVILNAYDPHWASRYASDTKWQVLDSAEGRIIVPRSTGG